MHMNQYHDIMYLLGIWLITKTRLSDKIERTIVIEQCDIQSYWRPQ